MGRGGGRSAWFPKALGIELATSSSGGGWAFAGFACSLISTPVARIRLLFPLSDDSVFPGLLNREIWQPVSPSLDPAVPVRVRFRFATSWVFGASFREGREGAGSEAEEEEWEQFVAETMVYEEILGVQR